MIYPLTQKRYRYSRIWHPAPHITGHFRDDIPSQSLDWCKTSSKPNQTATKLQHKNLNNSYTRN